MPETEDFDLKKEKRERVEDGVEVEEVVGGR